MTSSSISVETRSSKVLYKVCSTRIQVKKGHLRGFVFLILAIGIEKFDVKFRSN